MTLPLPSGLVPPNAQNYMQTMQSTQFPNLQTQEAMYRLQQQAALPQFQAQAQHQAHQHQHQHQQQQQQQQQQQALAAHHQQQQQLQQQQLHQQYHQGTAPQLPNNPLLNQQPTRVKAEPTSQSKPSPSPADILIWQEFFVARPQLRQLATNPHNNSQFVLQTEFEKWRKSKAGASNGAGALPRPSSQMQHQTNTNKAASARPNIAQHQSAPQLTARPPQPAAPSTQQQPPGSGQTPFDVRQYQAAQQRHQQQQQQAAAQVPPIAQTPAAMLANAANTSAAVLKQSADDSQKAALQKLATTLAFISRPSTAEEKTYLPRPRLRALAKKACGDVVKLSAEAEFGMKALAEDFSKGAISFAIAAARRKKMQRLDPGDVALYMKQTFGIDLPGFNRAEVVPYRRLAGSEVHKARLAAVRRANVALTKQTTATGAGAGPSGVAKSRGTGGDGKKGGKGTPSAVAPAGPSAAPSPSAAGAGEESEMEEERVGPGANGAGGDEEEDMPDI